MTNFVNNSSDMVAKFETPRYVILENDIPYDWDDYDVWGAVLYDIATDDIVTTKYGHGTDMSEAAISIELSKAVETGLITVEKLISSMISKLAISTRYTMENIAICASFDKPTCIPVKVVHGRKFKGDGYLIYGISSPVRYGLGAYRNEYNHYPVIFDPKTGTENVVNSFGYLEFDSTFMENFRNIVIEKLEKNMQTVRSIAHIWAYRMSYSACDTRNADNALYQLANTGKSGIEILEIVKNGLAIIKANKEKAEADRIAKLKEEKMPAIIEWVKTRTDKTTEDEIMQLAEHIFNKHNR